MAKLMVDVRDKYCRELKRANKKGKIIMFNSMFILLSKPDSECPFHADIKKVYKLNFSSRNYGEINL